MSTRAKKPLRIWAMSYTGKWHIGRSDHRGGVKTACGRKFKVAVRRVWGGRSRRYTPTCRVCARVAQL